MPTSNKKKQDKNTNPIISRQHYHLIQLCPSEEKRTEHKSHPIWSLHKPLDQYLEGRNQKEERIKQWSLGKGDLKQNKLKNDNNEKAENAGKIKEQPRNTEV